MTMLPILPPRLAPAEVVAQLRDMDVPQLRVELARALTISAEHLVYLAEVWRELERRGEDLSDLRAGLGAWLPLISAGRLAAEAVVAFAGQRALLRAVSWLSIEEQRRIAAGAVVTTIGIDAAGGYAMVNIPVTQMTAQQVRLVFDGPRIRRPEEQIRLVGGRIKPASRSSPKLRLEQRTGRILIGSSSFSPAELVAAISDLFPPGNHSESAETPVTTMLTQAAAAALKTNAAESGMSVSRAIKYALHITGLTQRGTAQLLPVERAAKVIRKPKDDRDRDIAARLAGGDTLESIGADYDISRERVRQIGRRLGIRPAQSAEKQRAAREMRERELREMLDAVRDQRERAVQMVRDGASIGRVHRLTNISATTIGDDCLVAGVKPGHGRWGDHLMRKRETAMRMLADGATVDQVATITGLKVPVVKQLAALASDAHNEGMPS